MTRRVRGKARNTPPFFDFQPVVLTKSIFHEPNYLEIFLHPPKSAGFARRHKEVKIHFSI